MYKKINEKELTEIYSLMGQIQGAIAGLQYVEHNKAEKIKEAYEIAEALYEAMNAIPLEIEG
jgi:hypothetical protein